MLMQERRVVVTGLGAVTPNGRNVQEFRESLKRGKSGIRFFEDLAALNLACQIGGIPDLTEESILEILPASAYEKMTEVMVYAALAAIECARSAGLSPQLPNYLDSTVDWDSGAIIGCGLPGVDVMLDEMAPTLASAPEALAGRGMLPIGSDGVSRVMASSVSAIVGRLLGLGGQVSTNSSACTTGTEAIFDGFKNIKLGISEAMYVGGVEGSHPGIWGGFDAMRDVLCSQFNAYPEQASQPMGAGACGFVPGCGAGVLRLESLEYAQSRGTTILAELVSAHCNSGGQRDGGTMTSPNPSGVVRCIRKVVYDAGIAPKDIDLINGHLTSTRADQLEVQNWRVALELSDQDFPLIQSTKSMIGHGLGAAGAMESVAVVDQMAHGYVHPSINCDPVHPKLNGIEHAIPRQSISKALDYVIKASFGFGDINGALLFKRWKQRRLRCHLQDEKRTRLSRLA